ncbi:MULTISPECIES: hypothetical protein [Bacteria]|jgi:hypothetical protein|uniref:hypothetical protein n=1 Tax=Bacteria TaxID=2 RepID=UPI001EE05BF8|nr:hypothetical protein [Eggerthella lenta]MCG4515255.1 hypothetical protein [Eggerthella lenta]BDF40038.1 hypothetical protein CE91St33_01000 [Eggerthella lenta]DAM34116.1 MAG TPA: lipoprotein [Caudoviricetes sp.]
MNMRKIAAIGCWCALALTLAGCGGSAEQEPAASTAQEEQAQQLDLTGSWKQVNKNSEDSWQEAVIDDGAITINWVSNGGDTKSLYWAGTYEAPTSDTESYSWVSENDTSQTDKAPLASTAETKDFKYDNGVLSYEATAMGTTTTVKMERQ